MMRRLTFALTILAAIASPGRAQGPLNVSISSGIGLGVGSEHGTQLTADVSADWRPQPLLVSFRFAGAGLIGDSVNEAGLLIGLSHDGGWWTASASAGLGMAWLYDAPPWFFADPDDDGDLIGPYLSLPLSGEVAVRVYGPFFARLRGIASLNAGESFAGTSLGWGLWF